MTLWNANCRGRVDVKDQVLGVRVTGDAHTGALDRHDTSMFASDAMSGAR